MVRAAGPQGPDWVRASAWRGLKAMAVGHGTAGDGRESGRGQASGDDLRAGRLPCDYASSDGRTWPGVEMAVTLLEIREDHA